jgi:thymidylate synthase
MNNLDKQYQALLQDILDNGVKKQDRTGTGTLSLFGRQIRHKMSDGFPLLTTKKLHWKSIVGELLWFLKGDTNIKWLVENGVSIWNGDAYKNFIKNPDYKSKNAADLLGSQAGQLLICPTQEEFINKIKTDNEFAKKWGELGPIYGAGWRSIQYNGKTIDQIANAIHQLKTNPDDRGIIVSAWNVGELDNMVLRPCHYSFQFYTRELSLEERETILLEIDDTFRTSTTQEVKLVLDEYNIPTRAISLMWNQRSVDVPLGLPFNIASYGLLLEIIGKMVNMVPDELIGNLGDTHIYLNQIDGIKEQLNREPYPLPTLNINTEFWKTESGECGVGPIDAMGVINSFSDEYFCKCLMEEDIQLCNYQSHPSIKIPLSN